MSKLLPSEISPRPSRRDVLAVLAGVAATAVLRERRAVSAEPQTPSPGMTLSIGNYGMQSLKVEEAIALIADTGYDGIELALMADWDSAPGNLSEVRRKLVRSLLDERGLVLTALMEDLSPASADYSTEAALERLKRAAELGWQLSPKRPPLVQTILGGGAWEEVKDRLRDRLGEWAVLAEDAQTVIAIKPHRSGAMSQPSQAVWLIEQLGSTPWLRMVYDYSHYAYRDLSVEETLQTALPYLAHVAVKDAVERDGRVAFELPGAAGGIDYPELLRGLDAGGYRGDICCEVSAQVFRRPDYDPVAAAKTCYANMKSALETAGIARPRRS